MNFWFGVLIGLFLGGMGGVFIMSVMCASGRVSEHERIERIIRDLRDEEWQQIMSEMDEQ